MSFTITQAYNRSTKDRFIMLFKIILNEILSRTIFSIVGNIDNHYNYCGNILVTEKGKYW
jgi:hypothetical protein